MSRVLTDSDVDNLVEKYRSGETTAQLMAAFKIGQPRLKRILADRGLDIGGRSLSMKLSAADAAELVERYIAGEGTKELGSAFGISGRGVTDYLRRAGVQARSRSHGIVRHMAELTHEERSAMVTESMTERWRSATPEDRAAMLDPMHEANRGVPRPESMKIRSAQTKSAKAGPDSTYEVMVGKWLTERGVDFSRQVQVKGWTADLAVGNVLVEVTTGWARKKDWEPRFRDFFDAGWHLYVIWHDTRIPLLSSVTDDLIAWTQILEANPPATSQHRVAWRSRKVISTGSGDPDYVAGVLRSSRARGDWPFYGGSGDEA